MIDGPDATTPEIVTENPALNWTQAIPALQAEMTNGKTLVVTRGGPISLGLEPNMVPITLVAPGEVTPSNQGMIIASESNGLAELQNAGLIGPKFVYVDGAHFRNATDSSLVTNQGGEYVAVDETSGTSMSTRREAMLTAQLAKEK